MSDADPALYVGVISGTSVDGLDLALLETCLGVPRIIRGTTISFDSALRDKLLELGASKINDIDSLGALDTELGRVIGAEVLAFLKESGTVPGQIRAIGTHGQTIRHRPSQRFPYTIQIGDPNTVAEVTGICTVADFRRRDLAAGGEGAPLVPMFHGALFGSSGDLRTVLNIGGLANITTLPLTGAAAVDGFDTGPGNTLLDAWIARERGQRYDKDGEWAASGVVDGALLEALASEPYFARPPPKSTGREVFNLTWLTGHIAASGARRTSAPDVQATLAELTAHTVADGIEKWGHRSGEVIVAGGGRLNGDLVSRIARRLPRHSIAPSESVGVNGDWLEAAAFAWLAHRALSGLPGNAPSVTGASGARVLGAVYAGTLGPR